MCAKSVEQAPSVRLSAKNVCSTRGGGGSTGSVAVRQNGPSGLSSSSDIIVWCYHRLVQSYLVPLSSGAIIVQCHHHPCQHYLAQSLSEIIIIWCHHQLMSSSSYPGIIDVIIIWCLVCIHYVYNTREDTEYVPVVCFVGKANFTFVQNCSLNVFFSFL